MNNIGGGGENKTYRMDEVTLAPASVLELAAPAGKVTKAAYRRVAHRHMQIVALHLAGRKVREICEITGYAEGSVRQILGREDVQHYRQQLLAQTQQEFEALFGVVVDTIRDKLKSQDEQVQLQATQQWLRSHGKFFNTKDGNIETATAEDVVAHILHANTINIQVNNTK